MSPGGQLAVCLMGPTASGKSALAMALAERFGAEVVSVDSALVYRGMDIGTAKPTVEQRRRVVHHLIDVADPAEHYSAGRFRVDALQALQQIRARGRLPLLAGGTLLYFRALRRGLSTLPPRDSRVRAEIDAQAAAVGWPAMHRRLAAVDPESAERIQCQDAQRIQRALEVYRLAGEPISSLKRRFPAEGLPGWRFLVIGLLPGDRQRLAERISRRFAAMMEQGLLDEVRTLYGRGDLSAHSPAMRAVGYRQLWAHLEGRQTLDQAVAQAIAATRQLARRQLTWLRREMLDLVVDPLEAAALEPISAWIAAELAGGREDR